MSLNSLEKLNNQIGSQQNTQRPSPEALRNVAQQFEAVLLQQLTSALSGSNNNEDGEDSLFGNDGGTNLAKQMFSEQMATAMAQAGGIGLADVILKSFLKNQPQAVDPKTNPLQKTISAVKEIRNSAKTQISQPNFTPVESVYAPVENISSPVDSSVSPQNVNSDSEISLSKRERIIADQPITENENIISTSEAASPNLVSKSSIDNSLPVSFQIPARGRISSTFGSRFHPIDKKIKFHGGLDIAIPLGTRVNSAANGVVTYAGQKGGYGNVVIVQHPDGRETRYGHLQQILVSVGDSVSAGQEVAKSGSTGKSTGPHLHFEIRENGQVVNPLKILSNVLPK